MLRFKVLFGFFYQNITIIHAKHCSGSDLGQQYHTERVRKGVWSDLGIYCLLRPVCTIVYDS